VPRFIPSGGSTRRFVLVTGSAVVAVAIVAGAIAVALPGHSSKTATAYFQKAIGIYPGSDVDILGVKVGSVSSVTPQGNTVRVVLSYDGKYQIPANADAVIVSPSLVADRYVQLSPVYRGGQALASGASIPQSRTVVPVEPDQATSALTGLSQALGPNGANKTGSLSKLLQTGAANLRGQGYNFHQTLQNASAAASALADNSGNFAETVTNLDTFISSLAANNQQASALINDLNNVSVQLNGERSDLSAALASLSGALNQAAAFVRQNRQGLTSNVSKLAQITNIIVKEKNSLETYLEQAPLAASNTNLAYDSLSGSLLTRIDPQQTQNLSMFVCSLLYSVGQSPKQCQPLLQPLNVLGQAISQFLKSDSSPITELTTHINVKQPPPDAYGSGRSSGSGASSDGSTNRSLVP
jgi:phospholipid/cholesterol/gamma-HCH transport system substrate-binding protein